MIKQIKSLVQFSRGSSLVWAALTTPIPNGVVSFSIDDGVFKLGDGVTLYNALPVLFTYTDLVSAQGGVSGMFVDPTIGDDDKIVIVTFNAVSNTAEYAVSDITLTNLLERIQQLEIDNVSQDAAIADLLAIALSIDAGINTGVDNSIITINNRRYSNSGSTLTSVQAQIDAQVSYVPGSHLEEVVFYVDERKSSTIDAHQLLDGNTYFVEINGFNNSAASMVYGLTSTNTNVNITAIEDNFFSVQFNNVCNNVKDDTPVILIASVNSNTGNSLVKKAISCLVQRQRIIVGIYGGTGGDFFVERSAVAIDSQNNVFAVGYTSTSTVNSSNDCFIAKYDNNLNFICAKKLGVDGDDRFLGVCVDRSDNIFAVGTTNSEGAGSYDGLIVKYDNDLNVVLKKRIGTAYTDQLRSVKFGKDNNIYVVGHTGSATTNYDALILKLDDQLNIITQKTYYGSNGDAFYDVAFDDNDNIFVVGDTSSEGVGSPTYSNALIVKFDKDLNIVKRKVYGGTNAEYFKNVAVDDSNDVIALGNTLSEGQGYTSDSYGDAIIVKFNNNLDILAKKVYGSTGDDTFRGIAVDKDGNYVVCGTTSSFTGNTLKGMLVKFDPSLNVLYSKQYGGANTEYRGIVIDANDNIICAGYTTNGINGFDTLVIKIPHDVPSGSFTGINISHLTFNDTANMILADSNLTLTDSTLTLAESTLTFADSVLMVTICRDTEFSYVKDIIN
jgi:small nuclear ribonucleoprotein (snRNP)-like protein